MQDDGVVLLACAGEEARYINQRHQRDIEGVAEAYEAGCLARCVAVEHSGEEFRLVGNDTYRLSVEAGETDDDVLGVIGLDFEEFAVVDDCADYFVHIVSLVGRFGDNLVELIFHAVDGVVAFHHGSILEVVLGNV